MRIGQLVPANDFLPARPGYAAQAIEQDMIELEPFCAVHGHDLQTRVNIAGHVLCVQSCLEFRDVRQGATSFDFCDHVEVSIDVFDRLRIIKDGGPAER